MVKDKRMNIFYLDKDPKVCAQMHNDKHVVKMILEYAQLLSTAHRINDGEMYIGKTENTGRNVKRWKHPNPVMEETLYKATHVNHPSAVWTRQSKYNYSYIYFLFCALCDEYTYRYGKVHLTDTKLRSALGKPPKNFKENIKTPMPQCMPDYCKVEGNSIQAYKNYYINEKSSFNVYTKREKPEWLL
jgi:hypothetical protein